MPSGIEMLLVDANADDAIELRDLLEGEGHTVTLATTYGDALEHLRRRAPDLLLTANELPDGRGLDLVERLQDTGRDAASILLVERADVDLVVDAVKRGAADVVEKPVFDGHLVSVVNKALAARPARNETPATPASVPTNRPSGSSAPM